MADMVLPGPVENNDYRCQTTVNIHIMKICDACRDRDCIEDIRVYPCAGSQTVLDNSLNIRPCSAELIYVDINIEEVSFNKGYYSVDVSYFYRITGEAIPSGCKVNGLAVFEKRVILFGSESYVKTYTSAVGNSASMSGKPLAVVEAVDPIILNMKLVGPGQNCGDKDCVNIPDCIKGIFGEDIVFSDIGKKLYVSLGQFSMIRLERDAQLTINDIEYFIPHKECACPGCEDPCALFARVEFPTEEFCSSDHVYRSENYRNLK